jgi:hypothetical protein
MRVILFGCFIVVVIVETWGNSRYRDPSSESRSSWFLTFLLSCGGSTRYPRYHCRDVYVWNYPKFDVYICRFLPRGSLGTQSRGKTHRWKPLPGNDLWGHSILKRLSVCCGELQSAWISDSVVVTISKCSINEITNPNPVCSVSRQCLLIRKLWNFKS